MPSVHITHTFTVWPDYSRTAHMYCSNHGTVFEYCKLTPVIYLSQSLINIMLSRLSVHVEYMAPTDDITLQAPTQCFKTFTLPGPFSGNQPPAAIHCPYLLSYHVRKVCSVISLDS